MLKKGQFLPDFKAKIFSDQADVLPKTSSDLVYRSELVSYSSTLMTVVKKDCPTCMYTLPFIERLNKLYGESALVVLLAQEDEVGAREMAIEHQLNVPILLDESPYSIGETLELDFVPSGFLFSRGGMIDQSFEAFDLESFEKINKKLSQLANKRLQPLFKANESIVPFRPG